MNFSVGFQVPFYPFKGSRCRSAREASTGQVEHEVKCLFVMLDEGNGDATAVAVKRCTDRPEPSEKGGNEMLGIEKFVKRRVPQPFFFFRVGGFGYTPSGFRLHGGFGLGGVFCHQIIVHAHALRWQTSTLVWPSS